MPHSANGVTTVIQLQGDLGPLDALELRRRINHVVALDCPEIMLDLSGVDRVHPAVAAVVSAAVRRAHTASHTLLVVVPQERSAAQHLGLLAPPDLLA